MVVKRRLRACSRRNPKISQALLLIERKIPLSSILMIPSLRVLMVTSSSTYKRAISSGSNPKIAR
ncbi:Uncharacterised protein [Vibrio cholerae]|nr:Uncharacterised protein [Vibrio cholerae]CSD11769.1 Uncharacterised protein [Vibrio cholerae]CSI85260.1 Uncharacterised protein [Vibrio cholerae]